MPVENDSLDNILRGAGGRKPPRPEAATQADADDADAISMADMSGTHCMRPANRNLTRIHLVDRAGKVRTMQYAHMDVEGRFDGDTFAFVFAGTRHWQVTVKGHGRKFWAVYDYISLHRWPYLREAVRGEFQADKDATEFTSIEIKDVTPASDG